jgi:flagellar assembly protein FliH
MTATAKFLFDTDFGGGGAAKPVITLADHAARLAQAEMAAYRNGYATAEAKARTDVQREAAAALARIAENVEHLRRGFAVLEARLEAEAVEVAVAVARKLSAELVRREPFAEISALVADCFRHLGEAPHVVVRVNDALYARAQDQLATIARDRGFEGRLVVLAEPEIAPGDCRIEWADGGVSRDRAAIAAEIEELIGRYLAARQGGAVAPPPPAQGKPHP